MYTLITYFLHITSHITLQVADTDGNSTRTVQKTGMTGAEQVIVDSLSGVLRWIENENKPWKKRSTSKLSIVSAK